MKIIIRPKNVKLTEAIEDFINDKIGSLGKFIKSCHKDDEWEKIKPSCEFFVEIEKETRHHRKGPFFRAEAQIRLPGRGLRAEAKSEDLRMAINEIKDELQQEMKKYKLRKIALERRGERRIKKDFHINPAARFYRKGRIREEGI